jgi:hypothetical protein
MCLGGACSDAGGSKAGSPMSVLVISRGKPHLSMTVTCSQLQLVAGEGAGIVYISPYTQSKHKALTASMGDRGRRWNGVHKSIHAKPMQNTHGIHRW